MSPLIALPLADRQYAQKRPELAHHIVAFHTRGLNTWETICGRPAVDPVVDVLPTTGHVCGHCTRIFIRQVDPGGTPDEQAAMVNEAPEFRAPEGAELAAMSEADFAAFVRASGIKTVTTAEGDEPEDAEPPLSGRPTVPLDDAFSQAARDEAG